MANEIDASALERRFVDRIVKHGGGHVQADHVQCVFAILRTFFTRAAHPSIAPSEDNQGTNRFLVAAHGDAVAVLALEVEFTRDDALSLVTWMTLVAGYSDEELKAARIAAISE
jgi:hypothetical protein